VYGESSASNSNSWTSFLVYFRDTLPLLRHVTSRNAISKFHHSLFHLVSCCLSYPPSVFLIIYKAKINSSPIHDIHLNTGTEGRCDIITVDICAEALQFSVDISTFPDVFNRSFVRVETGKVHGLSVCLNWKSILCRYSGRLVIMIQWSLYSSQSEWYLAVRIKQKWKW